jgi:hypothetical protein
VELCSTPEKGKWGRRSPYYMKTMDLGDKELQNKAVYCNIIIKDYMIQIENFILTCFIAYSPCHKLKFNENEVDNTFGDTTHKTRIQTYKPASVAMTLLMLGHLLPDQNQGSHWAATSGTDLLRSVTQI